MTATSDRFKEAIARFDAANAEDPNKEIFEGKEYTKEQLYAERMTAWLKKFEPNASEALQLAARAQHICRWKIPRSDYPMNRKGYNDWRTTLAKFHGDTAAAIMKQVGYDDVMCEKVKELLLKDRIKLADPDGQTLEDVICLVFLAYYFIPFAPHYTEPKLIGIVQKTWKKMSERGHKAALELAPALPADLLAVVQKAITTA
ncbi:MAG TPA: DUF4202 domain-containing protein [Sulfuricella sp.]|nr:DUF4202 domain-containing protein [Sulfuricella sp.]